MGFQKYEFWDVWWTADDGSGIYGDWWRAQTFTVGAYSHNVTAVEIYPVKHNNPGDLTVSIRATNIGDTFPTGSDLSSGTINANLFGEQYIGPYGWKRISLSPTINLSPNTRYAIVLRALAGDVVDYVEVCYATPNPYADGMADYSADAGVTWDTWAAGNADISFRVLGDPVTLPTVMLTHRARRHP
jgi:hypothetical protein